MRARFAFLLFLVTLAAWITVRACETPSELAPRDSSPAPVDAPQAPTTEDADAPDVPAGPAPRRRVRVDVPAPTPPDRERPPATEEVSPPWLDLALPRRTLQVTVVDETGAPRDDVDVHLLSTWLSESAREALRHVDLMSRHLVSTARPGADGRIELSYVEGGACVLVAGEIEEPLAVRPRAELPATGGQLVVPREQRTLTVVVRRTDGTPEPGAFLRVERDLPWEPSPLRSFVTLPQAGKTDARGVARIGGVAPGPARLFVSPGQGPPPDAQVHVDVRTEGDTRVEVVLEPVRVLRGIVTSSATGQPLGAVAWTEVVGSGAWVRTNAAGRFELPARPGGEGTVRARVSADGHTPAELLWRVDPGAEPIEVTLDPLATLRILCRDEDGSPLKNVTALVETPLRVRLNLSWVALMHRHVAAATSDANGLLEIAVPAAGSGRDGRHTVALYRGGVHVTSVEVPSPSPGSPAGDFPVTVPPWPTPR